MKVVQPITWRGADFEAEFALPAAGRVTALTRICVPAPFTPERTAFASRALFDLLCAAETLNAFLAEPPGGLDLDALIDSQCDWPDSQIAALARAAQRAEALASPCEPGPETLSPAERASLLQPAKENL